MTPPRRRTAARTTRAGWVISNRPAHRALVSAAGFIAAQDVNAVRGPAAHGDMAALPPGRAAVTGYLRERRITLTYDPAAGTLQAGTCETTKTVVRKAS